MPSTLTHERARHARLRQAAERKLARFERQRAVRETSRELERLKDECAKQIAQIDDDRAHSLRPSWQLPPGFKCVHFAGQGEFYCVVACKGDAFVSVVDGETSFRLGSTLLTKRGALGWAPVDCCFLAYETPMKALEAPFPKTAKALTLPRVLLKVTTTGNAYEEHKWHGGVTRWTGKVALSRLTVTRVMTDAFRPDLRDPTFFRIRKSFGKA